MNRQKGRKHGSRARRTVKRRVVYAGVGVLLVAGLVFVIAQAVTAKVYPPTGMQDHVESYPECRICPAPIPETIQRHILEHREPGNPGDKPGILVQYNCAACPEVVAKLTRIVERYPRGVYLAPHPRMSPRIALTALGQMETMDEVDEGRIVAFINKHL